MNTFDLDEQIKQLSELLAKTKTELDTRQEEFTKLRGRFEFLIALKNNGYNIVQVMEEVKQPVEA